jgi:hypothetical protein
VHLPTREQHRCIREEVDAVEAYSESTCSYGIKPLVTASDLADSLKVVLISYRNFPGNTKPRIIADEQSRRQQGTVLPTLCGETLSISLVEGHDQLGSPGIVCILNELLDNRAAE